MQISNEHRSLYRNIILSEIAMEDASTFELADLFITLTYQSSRPNIKKYIDLLGSVKGVNPPGEFDYVCNRLAYEIQKRLIEQPVTAESIKIVSILNDLSLEFRRQVLHEDHIYNIIQHWLTNKSVSLDQLRPAFESVSKFGNSRTHRWTNVLIQGYNTDPTLVSKEEIFAIIERHMQGEHIDPHEALFLYQQKPEHFWKIVTAHEHSHLHDYDYRKDILKNLKDTVNALHFATKLPIPIAALLYTLGSFESIMERLKHDDKKYRLHYPVSNLALAFDAYNLHAMKPLCAQYLKSKYGDDGQYLELFLNNDRNDHKVEAYVEREINATPITVVDLLEHLTPEIQQILNAQTLDAPFDVDFEASTSTG